MSRLVDMAAMVLRCKQRCDMVGNDFIAGSDTTEWNQMIAEVWAQDVFQVVADTGLRYFETTSDLTSTGVAYIAEPTPVAKVVRLDYVDSSGELTRLQRINSHEGPAVSGMTGSTALFYALIDDRFYFYPTPASGQTYRLVYVPQAPDVTDYASDACVDYVSADGEACVIWGVAALAKIKQSQDASIFLQKQELHRDRLQAWAADRVISEMQRQPAADEYGERGYEEGDYR